MLVGHLEQLRSLADQAKPLVPKLVEQQRQKFLERWKGFHAFRFMDWQATNNSKLVKWADRPTPDDHSQALKGVALEYMIQLCNALKVEPWFGRLLLGQLDLTTSSFIRADLRLNKDAKSGVIHPNKTAD